MTTSAIDLTEPGTSAEPARVREIAVIRRPPPLHWVGDGFRVAGYFNTIPDAARKLSPFLLLDYHPSFEYAPSETPRGVGVHPHRGFETVTIAWEGSVAHHDSAGNSGVIGPGDVQWMTAASGILHKEYHERSFARQGGPFRMYQLWVNLPRAHKMDPPGYQGITADRIGQVTLPGDAGRVRIIAGEYQGIRGPARTFTPVDLFDVQLNPGGTAELAFPARHNTALLVMKGDVVINDEHRAALHDFVLFANRGERISVQATTGAELLVMSGEPIVEPIVSYGPFVMNEKREILEAISDFESGKFGHLED